MLEETQAAIHGVEKHTSTMRLLPEDNTPHARIASIG